MRRFAALLLIVGAAPLGAAADPAVSAILLRDAAVPGLGAPVRIFYFNAAAAAVPGATITVRSPHGFVAVPPFCTVEDDVATCAVDAIPPDEPHFAGPQTFDVEVKSPDASDAAFEIVATIEPVGGADANPLNNRWSFTATTYRTFFVMNDADQGSGSFRAAIETANASCFDATPCLIAFRIPPSAAGWHTIRPASPLPVVGGLRIEIDASLQAQYFSDTNDFGPEVELSGALLREGDGLVVATPCTSAVRGLAINDFPRLGLLLAAGHCELWPRERHRIRREIVGSHIGTDPTGTTEKPNLRGLHIAGTGRWSVRENVISGNRFSGIFLESGVNVVERNVIGLDRAVTGPLSNGGSGVWIGAGASGSTVDHNMIGFNHHAGVAIDRDARSVSVYGNSLQANHHRAIDWGLDGTASGPVPVPVITRVFVDDGVTVVEGLTGAVGGTFPAVVQVYANDAPDPSGFGEGQYFLGSVRSMNGQFRFVYDEDLSGKWIAATNTREEYHGWAKPPLGTHADSGWGYLTTTSEFSRTVEVPASVAGHVFR